MTPNSFLTPSTLLKPKPHPARFIGVSHAERGDHDFYKTPAGATQALLDAESFPGPVWEPACGDGAVSRVLESNGYTTLSYDLIDRGYGTPGHDFFDFSNLPGGCQSLVTNPPYEVKTPRGKLVVEDWISHALSMPGLKKMALFLKTVCLAGQARSIVLERAPFSKMYQFRGRIDTAKNGKKSKGQNMIDFAWYIFERGHAGPPSIHWIDEADVNQMRLF